MPICFRDRTRLTPTAPKPMTAVFMVDQRITEVTGSGQAFSDEDGALPPHTPGPGRIGGFEGAGKRWLHYRAVEPPQPRHRLLYFHGIESHGGWFLPAAHLLRECG